MISTDKIVPTIPAKNAWEYIEDWDDIPDIMQALDEFDPSTLTEEQKKEFCRRNPFDTDYYREEYNTPVQPIERRLHMAEWITDRDREELEQLNAAFLEAAGNYLRGFGDDTEIKKPFDKVRAKLIRAIGTKAAAYIVRKEFESRTEADWQQIAKAYQEYDVRPTAEWHAQSEAEVFPVYWDDEVPPAKVSDKIERIRKGCKNSEGRAIKQRDFAKLIGYPINKYLDWEQGKHDGEEQIDPVLAEKLILIVHASPNYLLDDGVEDYYANYPEDSNGDEPDVFAGYDEILQWVLDGKPMKTHYWSGILGY